MKSAVILAMFFPLVAFCVAGLIEWRANNPLTKRLRNLVPVGVGLFAFLISLDPADLFGLTPSSSLTLSRAMVLVSAAIACSGAFMTYSRRASSVLIACGGLALTLSWIFNRILA